MSSWETERRKVWGLMLDLKNQIKTLKQEIHEIKNIDNKPEQPAQQAEA